MNCESSKQYNTSQHCLFSYSVYDVITDSEQFALRKAQVCSFTALSVETAIDMIIRCLL